MNELNKYIASGIIEAYCLGNLSPAESAEVTAMAARHPEVQAEIDRNLAALEQYAQEPKPRAGLKKQVLHFLDNFLKEEPIDLQNPPLIDQYSDPDAWARAVKAFEPDFTEPGMASQVLLETENRMLSVVWLSGELVEDRHAPDEFLESFLILEGACECDFGGVVVRFSAGDYFDIPPNTRHTIRNVSEGQPYVKGLVQRWKAA